MRIWASDGGVKIPQEDRLAFDDNTEGTSNTVWDGSTIKAFGARNEIISFAVIVEAGSELVSDVAVDFSALSNGTFTLATTNHSSDALFDWRQRPIEVFAIRYLRIHGVSRIAYDLYDETHTPLGLQRPYVDNQPVSRAVGIGDWQDRPNADKSYPDIAVPQEVAGTVNIAGDESQMFWVDIYLPKDTPKGMLTGSLEVTTTSGVAAAIPVEVEVLDITLPDERASKTMLYAEAQDIQERYFTGVSGDSLSESEQTSFREIMNRHYMLAWRHGVSMIDANELVPGVPVDPDKPNIDWQARLAGELYTAANGYAGPGEGLAHDVYSIGTYDLWTFWWNLEDYYPRSSSYDPTLDFSVAAEVLREQTDLWETWFRNNSPDTERFLYVYDEPSLPVDIDFAEQVANTVIENPGIGGDLQTFVTANAVNTQQTLPSPEIIASLFAVAPTVEWDLFVANSTHRELYLYNGRRPATGTFATDDDGVALRELSWGQYKRNIKRWFYWNSTYYNNFQGFEPTRDLSQVFGGEGESYRLGTHTNLFKSAHTFGGHSSFDNEFGESGFNYSNGDGVLFYPGTDMVFPDESYGLEGPIASLRLKHWRRGIQDVQYLTLAEEIDPIATQEIVDDMVPQVLWELGVHDPADPTFVHEAPTWSTNPDDWEGARRALAEIIASANADIESDGVLDNVDNCQLVANPNQLDSDNDGFGNRCDADLNNDCTVNIVDFSIFRSHYLTTTPVSDFNGDGVVNIVDFSIFRSLYLQPPGPGAAGITCG